jgi:hypothetical protein
MVSREQLYILDYYKRNTYMGSDEKLYYRVHRVEVPNPSEEGAVMNQLEAICWEGPYIFDKTPEEQKQYRQFEYSEEGMTELVAWLNAEHDKLMQD